MDKITDNYENMEGLVLDQDSIYEINMESIIISWNPGAERLYGWNKNEAVGKTAYQLFKTKFHLKMYDFITQTAKNYIWTGNLDQHKKDGSRILVSSRAILHRDAAGRPSGIIFVNNDITSFKQNEEMLKRSEENMAVTLSSIGDGVLAMDEKGCVTYLNPVAEQLTGWTQKMAFGLSVNEVFNTINQNTRKPSVIPVKEILKKGIIHGLEYHTILVSRDGKEYDIADSCAPIHNREGLVTGAVLVFRDVTEDMKKEAVLEKTSKELKITKKAEEEALEYAESLIDTIREPLIALDQNLRIVTASRSFYEFFKVKPADTIGKLIYDLGNKQWNIPKLRRLLETILPQKATFENYEVVHDFIGIGRRVMLLNARQIKRVLGKERIILLAIEDVTQRRESEYLLEKISRTLRAISNTNQILMQVNNEQSYLEKVCKIVVNECGVKMAWIALVKDDKQKSLIPMAKIGVSMGNLKKLNLNISGNKDIRYPAVRAIREGKTAICKNVMEDGDFAPWRAEAEKQGYASIIALPFKSINRVSGVLVLCSDKPEIYPDAEVKLLEELAYDLSYGIMLIRIQNEKKAAELEIKKIAAFPKLDPNPISEIDSAEKIYYINPAFRRLFPDALKETLLHPWFEGIGQVFRNLKGERRKVITRDIKVKDKHYMQTMVYMPDTGTIRTYGIDITERKNAGNELKRLYAEMEIKVQQRTIELLASKHLADIGTLAATVAHELRNPLGVINLASYNLRKKVKDKEMLKHLFNIEKKVEESAQIINNLLVYSRMKMPEFEEISIFNVISECAENVKKNLGNSRVTFKKSLRPVKKVMMFADPLQLKEVFTNIITNAYQAIDGKRGIITLKASVVSGKRIVISVKDTGVGISVDDMKNIFKPFFTRKTKGTGLGLVICRDIISMHNGTIDIKSVYGKGSTFTLIIPLRKNK